MDSKERRSALAVFYTMRVAGCGIMLMIPSFIPFFRDHGIGLLGVAVVEFFFGLTAFLLDLPSGRLADRIGRKWTLLIGRLLMAAGCFSYSHSGSLLQFCMADSLLGAGLAFSMGADEALLRSFFPKDAQGALSFSTAMLWMVVVDVLSGAAAMLVGPTLFAIDPQLPFRLAASLYLLAAFLVYLIQEPERIAVEKKCLFTIGRHCLVESGALREVILFQAVIWFFLGALGLLYEPVLRGNNVALSADGPIFAFFGLATGIASFGAHALARRYGFQRLQGAVFISVAAGLLLLGLVRSELSFLFLLLPQIVRGILPIIITAPFNDAVHDEFRATALSVKSTCSRIGDWLGKLLGLSMAAALDVRPTVIALGLLASGFAVSLGVLRRRIRGASP